MQSLTNLETLAIIGSRGMLGSDLAQYFSAKFKVTSIDRNNYHAFKGKSFNVVINANGNSKRFWANQNPEDDFFASTVSVYKSIFDFNCDIYVYISSPDVYKDHKGPNQTEENMEINSENLRPYGFNKYLSELIVKNYCKKFLILRSAMILGTSLKKGPFYDIMHNNPIFITMKSKLQLITTHAIGEIIETLLNKSVTGEIINIGGIDTFNFVNAKKFFPQAIQVSPKTETQIYEMNIEKLRTLYPDLKTSEEYLEDFLR